MEILLKQCKKQSRKVLPEDIERVKKDADQMIDICRSPKGRYPFAYAIAHCQVTWDDPLRFFVTTEGRVIMNPKMVVEKNEQGEVEYTDEKEGCMSFPHRPTKKVRRFNRINVSYQEINDKGEILDKGQSFEGLWARVFQHEIDHFNGIAIY